MLCPSYKACVHICAQLDKFTHIVNHNETILNHAQFLLILILLIELVQ